MRALDDLFLALYRPRSLVDALAGLALAAMLGWWLAGCDAFTLTFNAGASS